METASLQTMIRSTLQIGAAALVLLLGVSVLLAWWVTRPVERAWKQQHQFLSDASHELKTPLTVILSNAELMDSVPLDPRPARWADNIQSEARQMKSLVEEMLTLARADNMYKMGLLTGARTKSANIVGQTMRLNPHGDAAIYETMVRLSVGYGALLTPFVDSKGNFGKVYSRDMLIL